MIALDTNVLVRYLVEDDADQAPRAAGFIDDAIEREEPMFVSLVVLCELVWVLRAAYGRPRDEIIAALKALVRATHLSIEAPEVAHRALEAFEHGRGDLADYIIKGAGEQAGCTRTATFDRALLREPGFIEP